MKKIFAAIPGAGLLVAILILAPTVAAQAQIYTSSSLGNVGTDPGLNGTDPTITFSEFPVGTLVSSQYASDDVVFLAGSNGNLPIIANDGAMPTSPVLSPNPVYAGDFTMQFPIPATSVSFLSGYWDTVGSGIINAYNPGGNLIGTFTDTSLGVDSITISGLGNIGSVYFNSVNDPYGADIDNLSITVPEPATVSLLGLAALALMLKRRA
jgi:hypothetical protein